MAAPTLTARVTPVGIHLDDGFPTVYSFERDTNISFWEKSVKPSGQDGGDPIPTSNMFNVTFHTMAPRSLKKSTEATITAAYDPVVKDDIAALINRPGSITEHYPDGSTYTYFGYLQKVEFSDMKEGEQPELTATICVTNYDPVNRVEAAPVLVGVTGT